MTNLILTGAFEYSPVQIDNIASLGYNIIFHADEEVPFNEEELRCEVLVNHDAIANNDVNNFKNLKFVQGVLVGIDKIPLEKLKEKEIKYCNSRGVFDIPIAEFVVMRILEIYKKIRVFEKQTSQQAWSIDVQLDEITNKKVAVLGTGGIGVEVAKRLKGFGVNVVGFNRSIKKAEYFDEVFSITELSKKIGTFDAVVIAIPITKETHHLFDDEMFALMKDDSIIINVGRGPIVCQDALVNALESGKLKAAAIDVFEKEPLSPESKLWGFENFYFSPHISFSSLDNNTRMFELIYKNLKAYKSGGKLLNEIRV